MRVVEHFFHELPILTKSFYFRSSTRHARSPWTCRATKCRSWRREGTSVMCPTCDTIDRSFAPAPAHSPPPFQEINQARAMNDSMLPVGPDAHLS